MSKNIFTLSIEGMLCRQSELYGSKLFCVCMQDPSTGEVKPTASEAGLDEATSENDSVSAASDDMAGDVDITELAESAAVNERGQRIAV